MRKAAGQLLAPEWIHPMSAVGPLYSLLSSFRDMSAKCLSLGSKNSRLFQDPAQLIANTMRQNRHTSERVVGAGRPHNPSQACLDTKVAHVSKRRFWGGAPWVTNAPRTQARHFILLFHRRDC